MLGGVESFDVTVHILQTITKKTRFLKNASMDELGSQATKQIHQHLVEQAIDVVLGIARLAHSILSLHVQ